MDAFPPDDRLPFSRPEDVAVNREARINGRQMVELWYSGLWRILTGLPTAGIGVAVAWQPDILAMVIGIPLFAIGLYLSWRGFSFLGDAITRNVTYVTGRIIPRIVTSKNSTTYYVIVGPVKSRISHRTYNALPVGLNCHAYYASGSLHLLSLELATEAEPHPSLRFGGDAEHAWDRLRWRYIVAAVAILGLAAGVHTVTAAHPAQTFLVSGSISDYVETTGKGAYRHVYVANQPTEFSLDRRNSYSPPVPDLSSYIGDPVDLYVDSDSRDRVLALRLRETLYATDYYLHPEHQTENMISSGATIALLCGIGLAAVALWPRLVRARNAVVPSY